ncbi:hypothetical protein ACLOJK_003723 [Asimina triloba]
MGECCCCCCMLFPAEEEEAEMKSRGEKQKEREHSVDGRLHFGGGGRVERRRIILFRCPPSLPPIPQIYHFLSLPFALTDADAISLSLSPSLSLSRLHFLFGKNFERATRIVDQGGVKRVTGNPSGRFLFQCKHQLAARLAAAVGACSEVKVRRCPVQVEEVLIKQMKLVKPLDLFQSFKKINAMERGRLLGLDVGDKYVGLAVSDIENKIASPLSVLVRKKSNIDMMARDFQTLPITAAGVVDVAIAVSNIVGTVAAGVSELSLVGFVVGYPLGLLGSASKETVQVKLFMDELRKTGKLNNVSYTYWDERFTSKCVEALLKPLNLHPVESKTIMDKFAAVGILQKVKSTAFVEYLEHYVTIIFHRASEGKTEKNNEGSKCTPEFLSSFPNTPDIVIKLVNDGVD